MWSSKHCCHNAEPALIAATGKAFVPILSQEWVSHWQWQPASWLWNQSLLGPLGHNISWRALPPPGTDISIFAGDARSGNKTAESQTNSYLHWMWISFWLRWVQISNLIVQYSRDDLELCWLKSADSLWILSFPLNSQSGWWSNSVNLQ